MQETLLFKVFFATDLSTVLSKVSSSLCNMFVRF
uniref:Uncharacterized protein n=1 Tax=Arundo donax TaxID=35708 RepID=A0A0A9Q0T2_ARUDO